MAVSSAKTRTMASAKKTTPRSSWTNAAGMLRRHRRALETHARRIRGEWSESKRA